MIRLSGFAPQCRALLAKAALRYKKRQPPAPQKGPKTTKSLPQQATTEGGALLNGMFCGFALAAFLFVAWLALAIVP